MAQNQSALDAALPLLACPLCHAALAASPQGAPAGKWLLCTGCSRRYPVRDSLPVLLASAAEM